MRQRVAAPVVVVDAVVGHLLADLAADAGEDDGGAGDGEEAELGGDGGAGDQAGVPRHDVLVLDPLLALRHAGQANYVIMSKYMYVLNCKAVTVQFCIVLNAYYNKCI